MVGRDSEREGTERKPTNRQPEVNNWDKHDVEIPLQLTINYSGWQTILHQHCIGKVGRFKKKKGILPEFILLVVKCRRRVVEE